VAEYAYDRFRRLAEQVAELEARAGKHTVADNLTAAAILLLDADIFTLGDLSRSRPVIARRARTARALRTRKFAVQQGIVAYLDAEERLGRVRSDADGEALALALVASVHHQLSGHRAGGSERDDQLRRVIEVLVHGVVA
jgi:hypothetical protein